MSSEVEREQSQARRATRDENQRDDLRAAPDEAQPEGTSERVTGGWGDPTDPGPSSGATAATLTTAQPLRQAAILRMQQTQGNRYVARMMAQRQAGAPSAAPAGDTAPAAALASVPAASPAASAPQGLIVDDGANQVGPGQMKKSEFLAQVRSDVDAAVDQALSDSAWAGAARSQIDAQIEAQFARYRGLDGPALEQTIRQQVPGAEAATTARALIPPIAAVVRQTIRQQLPASDGVSGALGTAASAVSSVAEGIGSALSSIGSLFFKAREGGPRDVEDPRAVQAQLGGGQALDGRVRSGMEAALGQSFAEVRVHTDATAGQLSDSLNARAFTVGRDIAFGAGEYQPGTPVGDALIAHELAHVAQQGAGVGTAPQRKGEGDDNALEADADTAAVGAVASLWGGVGRSWAYTAQNAVPNLKSGLRLQRCSKSQTTTRDVSQTVTETISNAPPPYGAWNGTFSWSSNFHLTIDRTRHTLTVSVRIFSSASATQKQAWKNAIETKWSNRYNLVVAGANPSVAVERFPITVDLQWVDDARNADYTVNPSAPGSTSGGRAGGGGTTSMTDWGTSDTVDVTHEFGHMLGNREEYFTTDGVDYTQGGTRRGFRDTGGGVMNMPSEDPFERHYDLIRRQSAAALGVPESQCTVAR